MSQESNITNVEIIKLWLLQIDRLRYANNKLKESLAKAISGNVKGPLLEDAEYFNQRFIDMDQIMELMRHDVIELSGRDKNERRSNNIFHRFEQDLERCETEFYNLEDAFLLYLSKSGD